MASEFSKYIVNMGATQSRQTLGRREDAAVVGAIGFDPMKMADKDIRVHCATKFGGDPVQTAACIDGIVKMRGQEKCETYEGITKCTKIQSSEFEGGFTPGSRKDEVIQRFGFSKAVKEGLKPGTEMTFKEGLKPGTEMTFKEGLKPGTEMTFKEGVKSDGGQVFTESAGTIGGQFAAEGYCAEGSVCGTPMYGRPLGVWILALLVIILALQGLQER